MNQKFKYHRDRLTWRLTWITTVAIAAIYVALRMLVVDDYLRAWIVAIGVALLLLCVLSIPRRITLTAEALEIHCLVEMTRIAIVDIASIRKVTRQEAGPLVLLLGAYGLFGYYGYYLDLRRWETVKVYATEWNHLVEIEDRYEVKYLVSCRDADRLVESVEKARTSR